MAQYTDVMHNAHVIVPNVLRGELHNSKPGKASDCSCCRHMQHMEHDALSVTHVSPWSLCTETAAWFRLYPFTRVHAAYSDSWKKKKSVRFPAIIIGASWGGSPESDSWIHGSLMSVTQETRSRRLLSFVVTNLQGDSDSDKIDKIGNSNKNISNDHKYSPQLQWCCLWALWGHYHSLKYHCHTFWQILYQLW